MQNDTLFIFEKGFNYSQDGPGNRLVYHLAGCNMFCPWCANPEGLSQSEKSTQISVEALVKEAVSSKMIFIDGGGVTFTGGEATLQKEALLNAVKLLKENGISTCIETNASLPDCDSLFAEIDYMIADFKSPNAALLKAVTGADLEAIKNNLLFRAKTGKPLLVRVPLIHFFNCGKENAVAFAEYFSFLQKESNNPNLCFEILTYHEFGKEKYEKLNLPYTVTDGFVGKEDIKALADELKKRSLKIINT